MSQDPGLQFINFDFNDLFKRNCIAKKEKIG